MTEKHAETPRTARILVVDDDDVDRYLVKRLLGDAYDVAEAASLGAARGLVTEGVDVVLLDDRLAGESGAELLPELVARGLPAVILTGNEDLRFAQDLIRAGARSVISKNDLTSAALRSALEDAVTRGDA